MYAAFYMHMYALVPYRRLNYFLPLIFAYTYLMLY